MFEIDTKISLPYRDLPELAETIASWYNPCGTDGEGMLTESANPLVKSMIAFCPWCDANVIYEWEEATKFFSCKCCGEFYGHYPLGECWECECNLPLWLDEKFCSNECADNYGHQIIEYCKHKELHNVSTG